MANTSADLTWLLVRNNSSFIVKNNTHNKVVFSREANNLRNENSFKYSGLAPERTVGLTKAARGVNLTIRSTKHISKPAKNLKKFNLTRDNRHAAAAVNSALEHYRPDLKHAAVARLFALNHKAKKPARKYRSPKRK